MRVLNWEDPWRECNDQGFFICLGISSVRRRERKMVRLSFAVLIVIFSQVLVFGQAEDVGLDRIVVTPYRYAEDVGKAASSITVINQQDIRDTNATTVLDAIRSVPGLVVRDYFGNNTRASVDFRGFGEQGGLNVLVLVDGRRVNEVDISGVDWTQVPLNQVERIEVIRGGNSVLYGDNAVSGVINIITRKGKGKPQLEIGAQGGSYDFNAQQVSLSGDKDKFSYWFDSSRNSTGGYRENSYYRSTDFGSRLGYDVSDDLSLCFNSGYRSSIYGLPGALSGQDIEKYGRRHSNFPEDHAKDKDYYFVFGMDKDLEGAGEFTADVSYREKKVYSDFVGANMGWNPILRSVINTLAFTPRYKLDRKVFDRENTFLLGFDFFRYDYSLNNYDISDILQSASDINKFSFAPYLQDELSISEKLILVGGFRYESVKYEFDYHDSSVFFPSPDVDTDLRANKKAYNGGLVYKYRDESSVYFNINQSFRFPAVDEYFNWGSLNTDLKPQTSRDYEVGIKHSFNPSLKLALSLYTMNIENELYYNPIGGPFGFGANENYDKTRHEGAEFSFDTKIIKNIDFFGNYSYTKAVFKTGAYDGNDIPMVPRHKGSVGLKLALPKNITLNIFGNYVGKRYFINDQANIFSQLNGYMTADTNISYTYKDFTVTAGVNNIFERDFSEYGVCNSVTGAKNYYPSPERNFKVTVEYKF